MAKVVTPSVMIAAIKQALLETPVGAVSIRLADGRTMQYDRKAAIEELAYWERKEAESIHGRMEWSQAELKGSHP